MASSVIHATVSMSSFSLRPNQAIRNKISGVNSISLDFSARSFPSLKMQQRLQVSFAAKPDTLEAVCQIVRKQLALADDTEVTGDSKFTTLGADSLDTVEIMMELKEVFEVEVKEDSAQQITTVQEAADLIEALVEKTG